MIFTSHFTVGTVYCDEQLEDAVGFPQLKMEFKDGVDVTFKTDEGVNGKWFLAYRSSKVLLWYMIV